MAVVYLPPGAEFKEQITDFKVYEMANDWVLLHRADLQVTGRPRIDIRDKSRNIILQHAIDDLSTFRFSADLTKLIIRDKAGNLLRAVEVATISTFQFEPEPLPPSIPEPEPEPPPAPSPAPSPAPGDSYICRVGQLNIRADHTAGSTDMGDIYLGDKVIINNFFIGQYPANPYAWGQISEGSFAGLWAAIYKFGAGGPYDYEEADVYLDMEEDFEEPAPSPAPTPEPSRITKVGRVLQLDGQVFRHYGSSLDRDAIYPEYNLARDNNGNYPIRDIFRNDPAAYWGKVSEEDDGYIGKAATIYDYLRVFASRAGLTPVQIADTCQRFGGVIDEFNNTAVTGINRREMMVWYTFDDSILTPAALDSYGPIHDPNHGGHKGPEFYRNHLWQGQYWETAIAVMERMKRSRSLGGWILMNEPVLWERDSATLVAFLDFVISMSEKIRSISEAPISPGWQNLSHICGPENIDWFARELVGYIDVWPLHIYQRNTNVAGRWDGEILEEIEKAGQYGFVLAIEEYGQNIALSTAEELLSIATMESRLTAAQIFSVWAYFNGRMDSNLHSGGFMNPITNPALFYSEVDRLYKASRVFGI